MASANDQPREVRIAPAGIEGVLALPHDSQGLVIFAHGSGSGRFSPRNNYVAKGLQQVGCATLLLDLLRPEEEAIRSNVFDIPLLASRLVDAVNWARQQPQASSLPIGLFGASTGAGAALMAAAGMPDKVCAIVSRGGRPDLAGTALSRVHAPTLLIVGRLDTPVVELNRQALEQLPGKKALTIISGATHLFEEPGTLDQVLDHASRWFIQHFQEAHRHTSS